MTHPGPSHRVLCALTTIPINGGQELRLHLIESPAGMRVELRVWASATTEEGISWVPFYQPISIPVDQLGRLTETLEAAERYGQEDYERCRTLARWVEREPKFT